MRLIMETHKNNVGQTVELLAPAGDQESLQAAIANGADAVYLGLQRFNARSRAENFNRETIGETIANCHRYNVRVYVAVNTLIYPDDMDAVLEDIFMVAEAGADAVIVQDLGLAARIHEMVPSLPIHASTQMTLSEPGAIRWAQEQLGVTRVILPRELSTEQIRMLRENTTVELEAFAHGALCISWSGQCHASLFMGGRSANRGECAQPCRLPYQVETKNGEEVETAGPHVLSPYDLCSIDELSVQLNAGITTFKIEGRLKGALYTAATVAVYRRALDVACGKEEGFDAELEYERLSVLYSRGFCKGYMYGDAHAQLVDSAVSGHQGLLLGTVTAVQSSSVEISCSRMLKLPPKKGDGLVFRAAGSSEQTQGGRVYGVRSNARSEGQNQIRYTLVFGADDIKMDRLKPDMTVWKTSDPQVENEVRKSYSKCRVQHPVALDMDLTATPGEAAVLHAVDRDGNEARVESEHLLEVARTHPGTKELIETQLAKLGDTPYVMGHFQLMVDGRESSTTSAMIPRSVLNELRRRLCSALIESRSERSRHRCNLDTIGPITPAPASERTLPRLRILVRNMECLHRLLTVLQRNQLAEVGIYYEASRQDQEKEALEQISAAGYVGGLVSPRVFTAEQTQIIEKQLEQKPSLYLARNLGSLQAANQAGIFALTADFSLNAANEKTVGILRAAGASLVTPVYELDPDDQIDLGPDALEMPAYFHPVTFYTQYCLYSHLLGTGRGYPACGKLCKEEQLVLTDRKGVRYEAIRDIPGRLSIISESPINQLLEVINIDPAAIRVELLHEDEEQLERILERMLAYHIISQVGL